MQRLSISTTAVSGDEFYYACTYLRFSFDYPFKEIAFCESPLEDRSAIIFIKTWSVFDLLKLHPHFDHDKNLNLGKVSDLIDPLAFSYLAVQIELSNGNTQENLHTKIDAIFTKLGDLYTRKGELLKSDPYIAKACSIIHDCAENYSTHCDENFPNPPVTSKSTTQTPVLDEMQLELKQLIEAGADILPSLRKGVNLSPKADEIFFLKQAMPAPTSRERRHLQNIFRNFCLLIEYGATLFCSNPQTSSILSLVLRKAFFHELGYKHNCSSMKHHFKKTFSVEAALNGSFAPTAEAALFPDLVDKHIRYYQNLIFEINSFQPHFLLYQDLIRVLMFMRDDKTMYYPITTEIAEQSEIARWVEVGQKALKLNRRIPPQLNYNIAAIRDSHIKYKLRPGLHVSTPDTWQVITDDNQRIRVKTMPLSTAINYPEIISKLFDIYFYHFSKNNSRDVVKSYFEKIIDSNLDSAYLDLVFVNNHISAFHIGKFICTEKDNKPALLYHGVLAAARQEVTQYGGLMTWIIYWRGFLPLQNHIDIETLTVVEFATLASYLQLIKLGISFNPQYDILSDWIPVLDSEIYSKEKLYRDETKKLEPGNIFLVSDPLAQFKPKEQNAWAINRNTITACRLAISPAFYDYIGFFKNDKNNYAIFQRQACQRSKL